MKKLFFGKEDLLVDGVPPLGEEDQYSVILSDLSFPIGTKKGDVSRKMKERHLAREKRDGDLGRFEYLGVNIPLSEQTQAQINALVNAVSLPEFEGKIPPYPGTNGYVKFADKSELNKFGLTVFAYVTKTLTDYKAALHGGDQ